MSPNMWSFETKLIAEVKKYECLYNYQSLNYKDVAFKDKLWQKVAQTCNASVEDCKKKWKHLRDCFKRLKKRELTQPKGFSSTRRPKVWRHKAQMEFLTQYPFTKGTSIYLDESEDNSDDYFAPPPTLKEAKNEEVFDECENVEEVDVRKDFEPDISDTKMLDESMFQDVLIHDAALLPTTTKLQASKRKDEDSTTLMFKLLDRKIKQATLTEAQISDIETSVMLFVYKKLGEYKS
ncbi:uncharacterized protein [Eurosta solidaginis]|uniref:uncharacterized protein n=1 Tax=Eurosta solidaginis TaxID=178769 RepID=UPI00353139B8